MSLKPITSIFIARLIDYAWVRDYFFEWSESHDSNEEKISRAELQEDLFAVGLFSSLESVLNDNDFEVSGLEFEKILYFYSGVP